MYKHTRHMKKIEIFKNGEDSGYIKKQSKLVV